MSREILFRGKRKDNGEWVEGYYIHNFWGNEEDTIHLKSGTCYMVNPETVDQYTGLTDKSGRKIFEGDIVDRKEKFPEIVIFQDGDWTLDYSYASGKESGYNYCNLGFYAKERGGVKVIGNIFDNPELLEGGKE